MNFKELLNTAYSVEYYNSNNDWGFGGAEGKIYNLPGAHKVYVMTAYFRHAKSSKFLRLIDNNGEYIFEDLNDTSRNRQKIVNYFINLQPNTGHRPKGK